ncbi:MAG: hypothetical protein KBD26_02860 [Candidatus Pacebacteria bacterium]|nr:hypothetical protein [Candidatus Paceibacterota bacterium]MBP9772751.1 hypothetical protein [Candidatus Paceibacterota bacterium]
MKKSVQENLRGTVSVEHLHHFRCGACDKWWSIGDPKITKKKILDWFCPWCGKKQKFNK